MPASLRGFGGSLSRKRSRAKRRSDTSSRPAPASANVCGPSGQPATVAQPGLLGRTPVASKSPPKRGCRLHRSAPSQPRHGAADKCATLHPLVAPDLPGRARPAHQARRSVPVAGSRGTRGPQPEKTRAQGQRTLAPSSRVIRKNQNQESRPFRSSGKP